MADWPALEIFFGRHGAARLKDLLHATIDDFEPLAIEELGSSRGWRVYFRRSAHRDEAAAALASLCGSAVERILSAEIPDEDWARRSQAQLGAVRVGRLVVSPPWDEAARGRSDDGSTVIVIDPSTGFGTGHHATTRLCLGLLQETPLAGRAVLDVGTGSGVLAIVAAKLGARPVVALDRDPDALQNARDNLVLNGVTEGIEIVEGDLGSGGHQAEVVLANLTGPALRQHARLLVAATLPGGELIVSGFSTDELLDVERSIGSPVVEALTEDGWAAARFRLHPRET